MFRNHQYAALGKSIVLIAAMWLWTDLAKTFIHTVLSKATPALARAELTEPRAQVASAEPANATPHGVLQRNDDCWAPDPVYGIRHVPSSNVDYIIDASAPAWSRLSGVDEMAPAARIGPAMKNGAVFGIEFVRVHPNSLYHQLGIEDGDVVRHFNGYEVSSPDRALELYPKLRGCHWFEVELERRGLLIRKTYLVK